MDGSEAAGKLPGKKMGSESRVRTDRGKTIRWGMSAYKDWRVPIAAGDRGLVYVGAHNETQEVMQDWLTQRYPGCELVYDQAGLKSYIAEITEYWEGCRQTFTFPLEMQGTDFQLAVWNALLAIPYGQTRSYTEVAAQIGRPAAVRAVGAAVGANRLLIVVPCHRVVGKNGALTGYRGGMAMKERLLRLETRC
jgi:methylated-DNA-[protein]-cysteine S-methyltransferase